MNRRKQWIVLGSLVLAGLAAVAIGSNPRYLENLAIGGGYGDANGGIDLSSDGSIEADSSIRGDGGLLAPLVGPAEDVDLLELANGALTVNGGVEVSGGVQMDGDLLVDGGDVGSTTDADLLGLGNGILTLNGSLRAGSSVGVGSTGTPGSKLHVVHTQAGSVVSSLWLDNPTNTAGTGSGLLIRALDSGNMGTYYGGLSCEVTDNTDTSEDGRLNLRVMVGGSLLNVVSVDANGMTVNGGLKVNGHDVDMGDSGGFSGLKFNSGATTLDVYLDGIKVGHIGTDGAYVDDV